MPLSEPQERELLHRRDIALRGYRRADGLFDIEAHLTDTKTNGFDNHDRGHIAAGEPLHDMWMRLTIDDQFTIVACEAATELSPYAICPQAAPNFARLAGLRIRPGFLKAAAERVGGVQGCTHLRELLQQLGTVAMQTLYPVLHRREQAAAAQAQHTPGARPPRPALIDSCHAWASDSPMIRHAYPEHYTGPDPG